MITRRHFFAALGATFLPERVWADAVTPPAAPSGSVPSPTSVKAKRFVCVYMPHGRAAELFLPRDDFRIDYEGAILAPFDDAARSGRSFRKDLLVVDGVDLAAGFLTGTVGHDGPRVILTGSGANGKNASLDQYLAVERRLGEATPLPSLVLAVGNDERNSTSSISYGRGGVPLPKLIHPADTFDALFGAALTGSPEAARARRERGQSALDFLSADLARLRNRAGSGERDKLEHHATALRDIERRLSPASTTCAAPSRIGRSQFPKFRAYGGGERSFDAITDLQIELIVRAFACDLTRFATLMLADLSRTGLDPSLPVDIHQDVAHRYTARAEGKPGEPDTWRALARQNRQTCSKVTLLVSQLDRERLLDDTVVLASSDMGDPARHSSRSVPTLLLGGGIRGGRVIALGDRKRVSAHRLNPNNRILTFIAQRLGVPITRFGDSADPSIVEGVLEA
ncbi:MAG: DUF1552 domain-containing protein [Myxococcota bacterium]